jgi:hypothetical protein
MKRPRNNSVMKYLILCILACISISINAKPDTNDEIIKRLDYAIDHRDIYFTEHLLEIDSLKKIINEPTVQKDNERLFDIYSQLFDKYKSFQYDSARIYIKKQEELANQIGDYDKILKARTGLIFNCLSTGIFTEAVDIVRATDLSGASARQRAEFYFQCIRLYSDMSNFSNGSIYDENIKQSRAYSDSVIKLLPSGEYMWQYAEIFGNHKLTIPKRIEVFKGIMSNPNVSKSDKAMVSSIIGDLHLQNNQKDSALYYKALSAILDIESAKRETRSKCDLALYMYLNGDLYRADRYINIALEDANFFNSRMRKMEICNILPYINNARYDRMFGQRSLLGWIVAIVSLLSLTLGIAIIYAIKQMKKLRSARNIIEERNREIESRNHEIGKQNEILSTTVQKLHESNKIKDEYIGYGFYLNYNYLAKLEALYKMVNQKLVARQYDDIRNTLKESSLRKEKESIHEEFDRTFLRIFPTFIEQYNSLFPPEEAVNEKNSLTSEMRIFALIRLGVTDTNVIASFLNYSVNTINTYKTKTKNKSLIPNEKFEQRILEIKSVS